MLSYPQISMRVFQYVDLYNKSHPESTALTNVYDNTLIYSCEGLFVLCLQIMIGHDTSNEHTVFNTLCQKYQATRLCDIPPQDAEQLWNEFLRLTGND